VKSQGPQENGAFGVKLELLYIDKTLLA
jgi:hypothetical protein